VRTPGHEHEPTLVDEGSERTRRGERRTRAGDDAAAQPPSAGPSAKDRRSWYTDRVDALSDDLSDRERQVLQALVDAHIASGEPIASRAIADVTSLQVSPQTIRNVLATLGDRGLITQPHTSAGRVPTDLGLRYYVDSLVRFTPLAPQVQGEIETRLEDAGGVDHALREASRLLSRLARQASVVVAPSVAADRVQHIEFIRLRDDAILLIAVSAEGRVQNRLMEWRDGAAPSASELHAAGRRMTAMLVGRTLEEGREVIAAAVADTQGALSRVEQQLLALSGAHVGALLPEPTVHVDGTSHLLGTAPDDDARKQQKELLELLDEQTRVRGLLDAAAAAPGVRIFIGQENPQAALAGAGVITATVGVGRAVGVIGVIGPRHLDYRRVVPLVDVTASVVSRLLGERARE
jgi:heat-inducible transcriptional repressor